MLPLAQGEEHAGTDKQQKQQLELGASTEDFRLYMGHQGTSANHTLSHLAGSASCHLTLAT